MALSREVSGRRADRASPVERHGIAGDRIVHLRDGRGRIITARTRHRLLAFRARLSPDGEPLIDGRPWTAPEVLAEIREVAGPDAELIRYEGRERFDVLPLLVATDGAIAELGVDHRRLRPNIVIAGVEGLAEREWPGHRLRIGEATIEVAKLRRRCVMTTFDPDTLEQDVSVLRRIVEGFGGKMALDCGIIQGGWVKVGDPVVLLPSANCSLGQTAVSLR